MKRKPNMTRRAFFISQELDAGLKLLKERDGAPEAESIRRAIEAYLRERKALGASVKKKT